MCKGMETKEEMSQGEPPFSRQEILETIIAEINDSENRELDAAENIMKICAEYFTQVIDMEAKKK